MKSSHIVFIITVFFLSIIVQAREINETTKERLNLALEQSFDSSELPGFTVAIVQNGNVAYKKSLGYANIDNKKQYSADTIQIIGSISKTFLGVALMKASEDGLLDLNVDINKYLPFKVKNPYYPNIKITALQLASHTSSINNTDVYFRNYIFENPKNISLNNFPISFQGYMHYVKINTMIDKKEFLQNILSKDGKWYKNGFYSKFKPGRKYLYSNLGANLASLILEQATGMSYEDYIQQTILTPLKMDSTGWSYASLDSTKKATLYFNKNMQVPNYTMIAKADGGLLSTNNDLSKFLIEMINGYNGKGTLISYTYYRKMFHNKLHNGNFWFNYDHKSLGHSGTEPGAFTFLRFFPAEKYGIIIMTNVNADKDKDLKKSMASIERILFRYMKTEPFIWKKGGSSIFENKI